MPNGVNFQPAVSELARDIHWLDNMLLIIITVIVLFVLGAAPNSDLQVQPGSGTPTPRPSRHNSKLEVAWTLIPIIILIVIGSSLAADALQAAGDPRGRGHCEGHRLPVGLDL